MSSMEDRWLSVEEIAEYLGVSKDTVYAWIDSKGMPAHRMGRLWKFKTAEVDAWVVRGGAARNRGAGVFSVRDDKTKRSRSGRNGK